MAANAVPISAEEMKQFLEPQGFAIITIPGTTELVYRKSFKRLCADGVQLPISLRVYTSIQNNQSRGVGDDAIRVCAWTRILARKDSRTFEDRVIMLGGSKRVHRVENWRTNLQKRLDAWETMIEPFCPKCGAPMLLISPKGNATWKPFYSCVRYAYVSAVCDGVRKVE